MLEKKSLLNNYSLRNKLVYYSNKPTKLITLSIAFFFHSLSLSFLLSHSLSLSSELDVFMPNAEYLFIIKKR